MVVDGKYNPVVSHRGAKCMGFLDAASLPIPVPVPAGPRKIAGSSLSVDSSLSES